jgi:CRP/FNR family transcriptional regulator, cyclic AMP receptor protein
MTLDSEVQSLRQVPMFRDFDASRLKLLAFTSERVHYAAGQRLCSQGEVGDAAFVILEGSANVLIDTPKGPLKLAELGRNALAGEMAVLSDSPRAATIQAVGEVTALKIDKRVFLELLSQFPQMALAVMREIVQRLEATNAKLAQR